MKNFILLFFIIASVGCSEDNSDNISNEDNLLLGEWQLYQICNCITIVDENQETQTYDDYVLVPIEESFYFRFDTDGKIYTNKYRNATDNCDTGNFKLIDESLTTNFLPCNTFEFTVKENSSDTLVLAGNVIEGTVNWKFIKNRKNN